MEDEEIRLANICGDLVSLKKLEGFPLKLLRDQPPGDWVSVRETCQQISVNAGDIKPDLFATWLPDPTANEGYVVVFFFDDESNWTMAARYNRQRLLGGGSLNAASQPAEIAPLVPGISDTLKPAASGAR